LYFLEEVTGYMIMAFLCSFRKSLEANIQGVFLIKIQSLWRILIQRGVIEKEEK